MKIWRKKFRSIPIALVFAYTGCGQSAMPASSYTGDTPDTSSVPDSTTADANARGAPADTFMGCDVYLHPKVSSIDPPKKELGELVTELKLAGNSTTILRVELDYDVPTCLWASVIGGVANSVQLNLSGESVAYPKPECVSNNEHVAVYPIKNTYSDLTIHVDGSASGKSGTLTISTTSKCYESVEIPIQITGT